ncbi:hypothetical protein LWI28_007638 [Acer negundo]|uniref:Protein kinase domain-containing protein n=1 Tax=Acer negundo TaxID=4023 RepID=A0AAD5NGV0_ACENE|nr:hypothetical protein LWI28_007638 [Acer negundo]
MKCFDFSNREKNDEPKTTKPISVPFSTSATSMSTDRGMRRSESEFNSQNVSDLNSQNVSDISTASSTKNSFAVLSQRQSNLRVFTFSELKTATKNFSRSLMIGEGGFGGVFRGVIRSTEDSHKKIDIAVKQLSRRGLQGHKEWVTEVNVLGVVEHPNLVKLTTLPWATRMKIAQDAARGLAYLHEGMEFQIIFRDFKSSNILLDDQWNAKLSDFGLARLGPSEGLSHVSTAVVGTIGYAAPEYIQTGRLTYKSDVWSYGIFLYELITGRRPVDQNRPKNEQKLLDWVRAHLTDVKKFMLIIDPKLEGKYSLKSAQKLAAIANKCLSRQAKTRPKMSEVLEMLDKIMETTDIGTPQTPLKNPVLKDSSETLSKRERLRKRLIDPIIGENGWFAWRSLRHKLVRTR